MGDFIHLSTGAPPWAGVTETYHFHDIPLVGLTEQHGVTFLFQCITGEVETVNLWSYTLVTAADIEQIDATETPAEFDKALESISKRPSVIAVAEDSYGILSSRGIESWNDGAGDQIRAALDEAKAYLQRLEADIDAQRDRLAFVS